MPSPRKTYPVLATVLVASWFLAEIGQGEGAKDTASRIGSAFWMLFGLTILAIVFYSVALGVRALLRRRQTA